MLTCRGPVATPELPPEVPPCCPTMVPHATTANRVAEISILIRSPSFLEKPDTNTPYYNIPYYPGMKPELSGCLSVLGISAGNHVVGFAEIQRFADGQFECG